MVELVSIKPTTNARLFLKLEYLNPSGSIKDRMVNYMLDQAERDGRLRTGATIVEATTGNTGIALALSGRLRGYRVVIVMPKKMSTERIRMIKALGADIIFTPGGPSDIGNALDKVREITEQGSDDMWHLNQFGSAENWRAHFESTGPEIWSDVGGELDAFVSAYGTGGTLTGVGRFLKLQSERIKVIAAEPEDCALLSGCPHGAHPLEGIADGIVPEVLDRSLIDDVVQVPTEVALSTMRALWRREGIICGPSTGCNVAAAAQFAEEHPAVQRVVTLADDSGFRYLSRDFCLGVSEG